MQPQEPPSVTRLRNATGALVTVLPNPARKLPEDLARLDARLRRWSASAESYALIDRYDLGDTWLSGGCLSLARALVRWAGGDAGVWTVVDRAGAGQHWVAHAGGWLLDGDGVTRPEHMQRRWRERERVRLARVEPRYVLPASDEEAALCPPGAVEAIQDAVRGALGYVDHYPSLLAARPTGTPPTRRNPRPTLLVPRYSVGSGSVRVEIAEHLGGMAFSRVGFVTLKADDEWSDDAWGDVCAADLAALARRIGISADAPRLFVDESALRETLRGMGLGSWMYAEAARLAWWRFGAVVAAGACSQDGSTSPLARRVWASAFLRGFADVEGNVMVWSERTSRGVETPFPEAARHLF